MDMELIREKAADNRLNDCQFFDCLLDEVRKNNIDLNKYVYRLCVEDVLVVLADSFRKRIASGELDVEDCIDTIDSNLDLPWTEYIEATIDARYIGD